MPRAETPTHSSYEFPWSPFRLIPFSAPASYHNCHHTHNVGNYATFFALWDTVFGTNRAYYKFRDNKLKAAAAAGTKKDD